MTTPPVQLEDDIQVRLDNDIDAIRAAHAGGLDSWTPWFRSGGEISQNMVWDFLACVQDGNLAYWSDQWAAQHAPDKRVSVPPQMLLTHSRFPPGPIGTAAEWEPAHVAEATAPDPLQLLLASLRDTAGLDVYTNARRQEIYLEPVHPGDTLVTSARISVSPVRATRLGRGVFVNAEARHRRIADELVVAESMNSLFVYASGAVAGRMGPDQSSGDVRPCRRPAKTPGTGAHRQDSGCLLEMRSLTADGVRVGDTLPVLEFRVGFMDLMRAAQGTRHPVPMHTDRAYARAAGSRDAFFSTLWQAGVLGRFVTDWSGPQGVLTQLGFAMLDNICPDDVVTVAGEVVGLHDAVADLDLEIWTQLGLATRAKVSVRIPISD